LENLTKIIPQHIKICNACFENCKFLKFSAKISVFLKKSSIKKINYTIFFYASEKKTKQLLVKKILFIPDIA